MQELAVLSDGALWALAVGFFSPPVIAVIQQSRWSARVQSLVAFVFYLVVGGGTAYFTGLFNTVGLATLVLIVFVTAGTSYKTLWHPTGVAPAIESATNLPVDGNKHVA